MKKKIDIQDDYNKKLDLLKKYDHNYFNLDSPLVSDSKYDKLKRELLSLEKRHKFLKKKISEVEKVGAPCKTLCPKYRTT